MTLGSMSSLHASSLAALHAAPRTYITVSYPVVGLQVWIVAMPEADGVQANTCSPAPLVAEQLPACAPVPLVTPLMLPPKAGMTKGLPQAPGTDGAVVLVVDVVVVVVLVVVVVGGGAVVVVVVAGAVVVVVLLVVVVVLLVVVVLVDVVVTVVDVVVVVGACTVVVVAPGGMTVSVKGPTLPL